MQIFQVCKMFGKYFGVNVMVIIGGIGFCDDIVCFQDFVYIVVGILGRIFDLVGKQVVDLSECFMFIMDEVDKFFLVEFIFVIE